MCNTDLPLALIVEEILEWEKPKEQAAQENDNTKGERQEKQPLPLFRCIVFVASLVASEPL